MRSGCEVTLAFDLGLAGRAILEQTRVIFASFVRKVDIQKQRFGGNFTLTATFKICIQVL